MKVAILSRQIPAGAYPIGLAYNPLPSEAIPSRLAAEGKKVSYFRQYSLYQDDVHQGNRPEDDGPSISPRGRYPTQFNVDKAVETPTSEPDRQRSHRRSPLSSCVTAAPSREAPPPPIEPQVDLPEDDKPHVVNVKNFQVEDIEQTPWHEYEIPSELELLPPDLPQEIRNIIQESLDEQRALRLSKLQAPAIVHGTANVSGRRGSEDGELVVAESSAMAANRHAVSLSSSSGTTSINLPSESATSVGSSNAGYSLLQPTSQEEGLRPRSSEESQRSDPMTMNKKLQKGREKPSKTYGLFRMLRRSKDAVPSAETMERGPKTYECTSCFDDIPNKEAIAVPCQHKYCGPCFFQLIATAIQNEDQFPPKCCLQEIPRAVLRNHLGSKDLASFDAKALEYSVAIGNRYYCPRPDCAKWIDTTKSKPRNGGTLTCPHCKHDMCTFCRAPAHAGNQDCPQDFGLDATLQQAERAGWQRCYSCRALVELNTGCRHITCKCRAEFCYTCGARWRTCVCTEEDQARRTRRIQEDLREAEERARVEEEEIRAAVEAVEEAERRAEAERAEVERRVAEQRAEEARIMAVREEERVRRIHNHFTHLREVLQTVQVMQTSALERRHDDEIKQLDKRAAALTQELQTHENEIRQAKMQIQADTEARIQTLKQVHALQLRETRMRHRADEDACLLKLTTEININVTDSHHYEGAHGGGDADGDADAATILDALLSAQELERATLRGIQAREITKYKTRG
ncbi:MAG: hypothetical protein L6R39_004397, partial [Caloplaca ligustica]